MKRWGKMLALVLALCLLASSACLLLQLRHTCPCCAENCPICTFLALCRQFLQSLWLAETALFLFCGALKIRPKAPEKPGFVPAFSSLITLKVKLSD